jgi:hypothetical protein
MASSGMLRRVALAGTEFSEELSTSFIRVTRSIRFLILYRVVTFATMQLSQHI